MEFTGKVVMITGASVGIGRGCAIRFAQQGADLALLDYNPDTLKALEEELKVYPVKVAVAQCDVSNEDQVNEAVKGFIEKLGKVDILVNSAALWRSFLAFEDIPTELWKKFIDINVMGVVYSTRAVLGGMIERGFGRIINVGSVAGVYGNAKMVHYSTTKGALIAMTSALAKEVTDKGVTVNCVAPGSVSPSTNPDITYTQPSELSFTGRTGSDQENADTICFLASESAAYISGQTLQIDGCRKKM